MTIACAVKCFADVYSLRSPGVHMKAAVECLSSRGSAQTLRCSLKKKKMPRLLNNNQHNSGLGGGWMYGGSDTHVQSDS